MTIWPAGTADIAGVPLAVDMIQIPLSQIESPRAFAKAIDAHVIASTNHMMGPPGKPAPRASELVEAVVYRQAQDGPVASRGPDQFKVREYEIIDDRPVSPEVALLRETIK